MFYCFFFFQAEDGIRDYKVTGVQTCALPIFNNAYNKTKVLSLLTDKPGERITVGTQVFGNQGELRQIVGMEMGQIAAYRSEERRVGKECRCRWWQYLEEKKKKTRRMMQKHRK